MSRPSRSSSISPFKELSASPSPSLPDEGYDEQRLDIPKWTLVNVALVSKAWNKFASDNAVWRGLYFRHGWTVNHEMVDWYINAAEQEEEWAMKARDVQSRVHFESEHSVSRGKRKMADCDMRDARDQDCGDYEMLQDAHDEQSGLYDQYQDEPFQAHQHFGAESSPTAHSEDLPDIDPTLITYITQYLRIARAVALFQS
ncbi:hypothetical protein BGZ72_008806 [Mortierella alpina]|nr:hypothetical protein BGZ72_008806 [Mortierella alpina]